MAGDMYLSEEVDSAGTPSSDAATAIVMNGAYLQASTPQPGRAGETSGSLRLSGCGSGRRVLFSGEADSGDDADDWIGARTTWQVPLVASTASNPNRSPAQQRGSSMEPSRMLRGDSVATEWADTSSNSVADRSKCSVYANSPQNFHVGIYGWRKRCLYILILGLLTMVIVNLALTLWILKVMEFSSEGMGQLRVVAGGIRLDGQAMVRDALIASTIKSRRGQPITIESSRNFSVNVRNSIGSLASRMVLGEDRLVCTGSEFKVLGPGEKTLFSANKKEVVIGADVLRITGEGGAIFDGTVQTPLVRANSGSELSLESPTRSLEIRASQGVAIESRAGDISVSCLNDLKLQSVAGAIRLDAAKVYIPGLREPKMSSHQTSPSGTGIPGETGSSANPGRHQKPGRIGPRRDEIFQLCVCTNGKLFLGPPEGLCAADSDGAICR